MRTHTFTALALTLLTALLIAFFRLVSSQPALRGENLLYNGGFEAKFVLDPECGLVGQGWHCFTVSDHTRFVAEPETWARAVRSGTRAQLLSIITPDPGAPQNRAIGLYQTVNVIPNTPYTLVLHGLIRANDADPDPWRYQVEWGYTADGSTDWRNVAIWYQVPWYRYDPREAPGPYLTYTNTFEPRSGRITLFVRLRVKWGTWPREVILNLDDLALLGPAPHPTPTPTPLSQTASAQSATPTTGTFSATQGLTPLPTPVVVPVGASSACQGPNLLVNGDFERGFQPTGVAEGWHSFTKGGMASFGFWDAGANAGEQEDAHGQVIAINTMGLPNTDETLIAGITQTVTGLTSEAIYQICLRGTIRTSGVVTGTVAPTAEWAILTGDRGKWYPLPWLPNNGANGVLTYTARFTATASVHTVGIRLRREPNLHLPEVNLVVREVRLSPVSGCVYIVQPGDTLSYIARVYHTTVADLAQRNHLTNPNLIRVGQRLDVPCIAR